MADTPTEDEVRMLLEGILKDTERSAAVYQDSENTSERQYAHGVRREVETLRHALALLDEARKDRERMYDAIAVAEWQARGDVHELTCGTDSRHRPLVPTRDGLRCLDCAWVQAVPAFVRAAIDQARGA